MWGNVCPLFVLTFTGISTSIKCIAIWTFGFETALGFGIGSRGTGLGTRT